MKIKSLLVFAVLATAIFGFSLVASPKVEAAGNCMMLSTTTEQMNCLQGVIAELMQQLAALQAQQQTSQQWCHTFNQNLGFAQSGSTEVQNLQIALQQQNIHPMGAVDGIYDEQLAQYVIQFQAKYGIMQSGFFGTKTRAQMNALYGCGVTPLVEPIKMIEEKSGLQVSDVKIGGDYKLVWKKDLFNSDKVIVKISNTYGKECSPGVLENNGEFDFTAPKIVAIGNCFGELPSGIEYKIMLSSPAYLASLKVTLSDPSSDGEKPSVFDVQPDSGFAGDTMSFKEGMQINIYWTAKNIPSDAKFAIYLIDKYGTMGEIAYGLPSTQRDYLWKIKVPSMGLGLAKPKNSLAAALFTPSDTDILLGKYWLLVRAIVPKIGGPKFYDAQTIKAYNIYKGDTTVCIQNWQCTAWSTCTNDLTSTQKQLIEIQIAILQSQLSQTTDSTKRLTLQLQIMQLQLQLKPKQTRECKDLNGCPLSQNQSMPVTTQECSQDGTAVIDSLSKPYAANGDSVTIFGKNLQKAYKITFYNLEDRNIAFGFPAITIDRAGTDVTFVIKNVTKSGKYAVVVWPEGSQVSSNELYISVEVPSTQPSITVTSPSGEENWKIGETHAITWNTTGYDSNAKVRISIVDNFNSSTAWLPVNPEWQVGTGIPNTGSYSWTIPSSIINPGSFEPIPLSGSHKIFIDIVGNVNGTSYESQDYSNYFTISSTTTQPSITLTNPNGGETYPLGSRQKIAWKHQGFSSSDIVVINVTNLDTGRTYNIAENYPLLRGVFEWNIADNNFIPAGSYKATIYAGYSSDSPQDVSDSYFKIAPKTACTTNAQCGIKTSIGSPFCQGNSVYQKFTEPTCFNPGTTDARCGDMPSSEQQSVCNSNQTCSNGACISSQTDTSFGFGSAGAGWLPIMGAWGGGDKTKTAGLYNQATSTFYLKNFNTEGGADLTFGFGAPGGAWLPIAGDWDGDGKDSIGLYDQRTSYFYLRNSNTTGIADLTFGFGAPGGAWLPIAGDWDSDGITTIGLFNPSTGMFYLKNKNTTGVADLTFGFGPVGAKLKPVAGDWDFNGTTTIGVYDQNSGQFYLRNANTSGNADISFGYGTAGVGTIPIAGNWLGTVGVYDPATSRFTLKQSSNILGSLNNMQATASLSTAFAKLLMNVQSFLSGIKK